MTANELIERMEKETGQRVGDNDGDNMAIAGLLGAMARLLGKTPVTYKESDDVAVGILLRHQMSPEGQQKKKDDELFLQLLLSGMSPDDIEVFLGNG